MSAEHQEWMARLNRIYACRAEPGKQAYLVHCLVHHQIFRALGELLRGQRYLSVVSCRDIGPQLKLAHQLRDVTVYQTPSQYVMRSIDGDYEARLHSVAIWPDFYRELRSRIEVRERGEVFLVGAGLFGKELCIHIRDLGGIALDMGSTLDRMAGKETRGANRPDFLPPPETPRYV
jgi:hypothetical protein